MATASLVGGIFGKGGGAELQWSEIRQALRERLGKRRGVRVFRDFRSAEDPEAPVTVHARPLPLPAAGAQAAQGQPRGARPRLAALPRRRRRAGRAARPATRAASGLPDRAADRPRSNALLVSARESASGHPLMVAGPQTGYFNPQILMEQEVHAPGTEGRPPIDARGASFVGINLYVQLGRGRDYAWSATSAGQDNIDTFALRLCDETHYRYRGRCEPIEVLEKTVSWRPSLADDTPAGSQTLRAERTKLGLVAARGTVRGKPVIFTRLRSTYFHEVDSAAGFLDFNTPTAITGPESFAQAASRVGYTFNWLYADSEQISYFNSGANPVRARRIDHDLPVQAALRAGAAGTRTAGPRPSRRRRRTRRSSTSATSVAGTTSRRAASPRRTRTRTRRRTARSCSPTASAGRSAASRKLTLPRAIDIMEVAGTDDLRAHVALPLALRIIGRPKDARLRAAVETLRAWHRTGGLRRDDDRDGVYDHSDAVALMDAWWPRWVKRAVRAGARPDRAREAASRWSSSTTSRTTTATTSARPTRAAGTATCARTCARCSAARCAGATRASTAAAGA